MERLNITFDKPQVEITCGAIDSEDDEASRLIDESLNNIAEILRKK